jgi:xanthosine utilization system XapX-like protein
MKQYFGYFYRIGFLAATFSLLTFFLSTFFTQDPTLISKVFSFIITPIFVGAGIYFYRFKIKQNLLSFAEGMTVGFIIYFVNAFVTFLGIYMGLIFSKNLFENIKSNMMQVLIDKKQEIINTLGNASYEKTYQEMLQLSIFDVAITDFIFKVAFGLFFTIIISIILRKT